MCGCGGCGFDMRFRPDPNVGKPAEKTASTQATSKSVDGQPTVAGAEPVTREKCRPCGG